MPTINARTLDYDPKRRVFTGRRSELPKGNSDFEIAGRVKTITFVSDIEDMMRNEYYDGEYSTYISEDGVIPPVRLVVINDC